MTIRLGLFEYGLSDSVAFDEANTAVTFYKLVFDEEEKIYLRTSPSRERGQE